ncbi:unnamed protein product [Enterobius vermicularis]|uniref:Uncharacterized protein n=1 Tax=Enterobius vermicularis TaxID=51028 RepID=A0A0N4UUG8_ENTVE|nr:unnamed protein product [Enterobius vermicularis]
MFSEILTVLVLFHFYTIGTTQRSTWLIQFGAVVRRFGLGWVGHWIVFALQYSLSDGRLARELIHGEIITTWFTLIEHIFDYSCTIGISNRATSVVLFVVRTIKITCRIYLLVTSHQATFEGRFERIKTACRQNPQLRICGTLQKPNFDRGDFFAEEEEDEDVSKEKQEDQETVGLKRYIVETPFADATPKSAEEEETGNKGEGRPLFKEVDINANKNAKASGQFDLDEKMADFLKQEEQSKSGTRSSRNEEESRSQTKNPWNEDESRTGTKNRWDDNSPESRIRSLKNEVFEFGGQVDGSEAEFCKNYSQSCEITQIVIPVITYCRRYYKHFAKFCGDPENVTDKISSFCFAFAKFCLPADNETNDQLQPTRTGRTASVLQEPSSDLKRCEDVVDEARKVCNPFPSPKDRFNTYRCKQFLSHCKKYVDWI